MKKIIALILMLSLTFVSMSLPASACYVSGDTPGCQVPSYIHNIQISSTQLHETFHPTTDIVVKKQMYLNLTQITAKYVYNVSTTDGIHYDYYLWGEYDTGIGTHEGVDLNKSNGSDIRASLNGVVIYSGSGRLSIYNASYNVTISYLHMTDITHSVDATVALGTIIGKQGSHLHIQVEQGYKTYVSSGSENSLTSKIPYGYMSVETIQPAS